MLFIAGESGVWFGFVITGCSIPSWRPLSSMEWLTSLAWYDMVHVSLPAPSAVLIQGLGDWGASVAIWGNNVISGRTELLNHSLRLLSSTLQWLLIIGNGVKIIPSICFLSSFSLICLWRLTFDGVSELVSLFFSFSISNLSSLLFFIVYRRGHMVPRPSYTM